ncbi:MAG TPA: NAD(+) diphosphatase [Gaiellaceae bacterium]|nr:NAD(+) diphosphatase [Gaiellaceae bacterium]
MTVWKPGYDADRRPGPRSPVFGFVDSQVLAFEDGSVPRLEQLPAGALDGARLLHVGELDGEAAFAATFTEPPEGVPAVGLRSLLAVAREPLASAASRAAQTVEWDRGHAFCGRCGAGTEPSATELARVCPRCGAGYWPRIAPAVIMLVERGDRILLATRAGASSAFYSCLAGFVEPGETLEQAVAREVEEEVGLAVEDVRYVGSQPWPFPSQLMVGFTAVSAGGEIRLDRGELGDAGWYAADALPPVPPPFTIARTLIDAFVARPRP